MSAVPAVSPLRALLWAPPVLSPSTSWESHTPAAPPSMETPHPGAQPRLMPTMIMSLALVPGGTVMPPALFKVQKQNNSIGDTSFSHSETAATTTPAPATTAAPGPVTTAAPGTCQVVSWILGCNVEIFLPLKVILD